MREERYRLRLVVAAVSSLLPARDLSHHTPNELVNLVVTLGEYSAQALEELRERALAAPFPFRRQGTM